MTAKHTCDKCAHYEPPHWPDHPNEGCCAKMGDHNDRDQQPNQCVGWDYEGYRAGCYVGPKFGCIHWAKRGDA